MKLFDRMLHKDSGLLPGEKTNPSALINQRAKALIEELVSPLSKPNQRIIDEVLDIITQASSLPDHLVDKAAVQSTTKQLLFQLVEPISNPNKQLIDELLQLVTHSGTFKGQMQNNQDFVEKKPIEKPSPIIEQDVSNEATISDDEGPVDERRIRGQAGMKMRKDEAIASAPYPSQLSHLNDERKDKETRSIMNLLLEQIKELITITNNLNTKLKGQQVRIDTLETTFKDTQKKSQEVEERMAGFEKNMEKFIGLYEVVTNQYNPFVEAAATIEKQPNVQNNAVPLPKPTFKINGQEVRDLNQFSDMLLSMADPDFNSQILGNKQLFLDWVREKVSNDSLVLEFEAATDKNSMIKAVFKAIHS